jgi:hypothetical protein
MDPQATAGRIVHYLDAKGEQVAAIVNRDTDPEGNAELTVHFKEGPRVFPTVPYSEENRVGCWSWMPYQKAKARSTEGNQSESAEPRPTFASIQDYADHLNDLNERVSSLEQAGQDATPEKEAAAAADPSEDLSVPEKSPDIGGEPPQVPAERTDDAGRPAG